MSELPRARTEEVVSEPFDGGLVVYDRASDSAHWLNADAAAVWRAADGNRGPAEIARECDCSDAKAAEVLQHLDALGLIVDKRPGAGVSRRAALKRAARISGTAAILAPVISTVLVPNALATASMCDLLPCSGLGMDCLAAKNLADSQCATHPTCRNTSTCIGFCGGVHLFNYNGMCSF